MVRICTITPIWGGVYMGIETYYETYTLAKSPNRKKRKRVNIYDPNASEADKRYTEHYGL